MTPKTRHDELKALLSKISEESVTTSNVLADLLDLLRDRLPEQEVPEVCHCIACGENYPTKLGHDCPTPDGKPEPAEVTEDQPVGTRVVDCDGDVWERGEDGCRLWDSGEWLESGGTFKRLLTWTPLRLASPADLARVGIEDEPAPADDLPGEPVEPGDLRAGDRVAFTWGDECITSTLVSSYDGDALYSGTPRPSGYTPNVVWDGEWAGGISDVRLIERAPREDVDPDEALASSIERRLETTHSWLEAARAAREHIEAEADDADFSAADLYYARATKAETERDALREHIEAEQESRERTVVDEWDDMLARAENAERALDNATQRVLALTAERDKWNTLAHEADRNAKRHHDRAEKAEAERDEWKARHEALREDVETRWAFVDDNFLKDILHSILKGDDERAKGGQR